MRTWKPGDVALVQNEYGVWNKAILQVRPGDEKWVYGVAYSEVPYGSPTRPLVVIDPEDLGTVERLTRVIFGPLASAAGDMAAYLREFADPKPKEPTGLGAVVECAGGLLWVLSAPADDLAWHEPQDGIWKKYEDIAAVRVFSEGWTA